jgi:hypothetical protein
MWGELVKETLMHPRRAARRVLETGMPVGVLVQAAVLVTCAGMLLGYLALSLGPDVTDISAAVLTNPLLGAVAQLAVMVAVVFLTVQIGRLFGGTGGYHGALALVVWLNAMMVLVQLGQIAALLVVPPLAAVLAIATMLWAFWAYANFVAELHGFRNPAIVLGAVVLTTIVLFFGVAMLLAMLGITPQEVS